MANLSAISAVCGGIAQQLGLAHQLSPIKDTSCVFSVVGSKDLKDLATRNTTCAIFLYRISHNEHTRNAVRPAASRPLAVNLHLMFSMWADSPLKEQTILAWVMRELYDHPILDRSVLGAGGEFTDGELVQLIPEELTLDDMSKLWQLLVPPYRLSAFYVARNVQIGTRFEADTPVVATRFGLTDEVPA